MTYYLNYADKELEEDIEHFCFDEFSDFLSFFCDKFVPVIHPRESLNDFERNSVYVFGMNDDEDEIEREVFISSDIHFIYKLLCSENLLDFSIVNHFFLFPMKSYEDAYSLSRDMKEHTSSLAHKK
jgi:hypothetical protein